MKTELIRVFIAGGYGGVPRAGVIIGDEHNGKTYGEIEKLKKKKGYVPSKSYVIDIDYLERYILKAMEEKGYKVEQSKRQKYPRIIIND